GDGRGQGTPVPSRPADLDDDEPRVPPGAPGRAVSGAGHTAGTAGRARAGLLSDEPQGARRLGCPEGRGEDRTSGAAAYAEPGTAPGSGRDPGCEGEVPGLHAVPGPDDCYCEAV